MDLTRVDIMPRTEKKERQRKGGAREMRMDSRDQWSWWAVESKRSKQGSEDTRELRLFSSLQVCCFTFYKALSHALFHLILTKTMEGRYFYFNSSDKRNRYREINLLARSHSDRAITHSESLLLHPISTPNKVPKKKLLLKRPFL